MENKLNDFSRLHLLALEKNCYYRLLHNGTNYEEYFQNSSITLHDLFNFFCSTSTSLTGAPMLTSFDQVLGFYLIYNESLNNNEYEYVQKMYNNGKDISIYMNNCKNLAINLKNKALSIASKIKLSITEIDNCTPVEYKEVEMNDIDIYKILIDDENTQRYVNEYDSCIVFNKLKTNNRFPLIIYTNSIGKIISRCNTKCSISFDVELIIKMSFPYNSIILCSESGDITVLNFNKGIITIGTDKDDTKIKKIMRLCNFLKFEKVESQEKIIGSVTFFIDKNVTYNDFYEFIMIHPIASILFFVNENAKPWCAKERYFVYFRDFSPEMISSTNIQQSSNYLRLSILSQKRDDKTGGFNLHFKTKNREMVDLFLYKMSRLMSYFCINKENARLKSIIKGKMYIKQLNRLNDTAPEIFKIEKKKKGEKNDVADGQRYCRKCGPERQPIIIEEDEIPEWKSYGREPKQFPLNKNEGQQFWFACPMNDFPIVGFVSSKNDLTGEIKFLPCCRKAENEKGFVDDNVVYSKNTNRSNITDATNELLNIGNIGTSIKEFLKNSFSNETTNISFNKIGTCNLSSTESLNNSFINSIIIATSKDFNSNEDLIIEAKKIREKMAQLPLDIYKQELYDMSDSEIIESILDPNTFIDPYLYYRGLEVLFSIQIFVFSSEKGRKTPSSNAENLLAIPTLEIPRCKYMHIRHRNSNPIICLYKNYGNSTQNLMDSPTCELIIYYYGTDQKSYNKSVNSCNSLFFNSLFNHLYSICHPYEWFDNNEPIEETCLDNPYSTIDWSTYDFGKLGSIKGQEIDMYGKTNCLIFDEWSLIIPPTQPLIITNREVRKVKLLNGSEFITLNCGTKIRPKLNTIDYAKEVFEYSEDDIDCIWLEFNGIKKGIKVPCISRVLPSIHSFKSTMSVIDRKNKTSILLQIINWLWRSDWNGTSFPEFPVWWNEHSVVEDTTIFMNIPNTHVNCNNYMLPTCSSFEERIKNACKIWPFFFYGGKIHISPNLNRLIINSFSIEDIYSRGLTPNDIYGEINRFIIGLIPTDFDYLRNDDLILTKYQHILDWAIRNNSIIFKYKSLTNMNIFETKILEIFKNYRQPFFFLSKTGKRYIVQNSLKTSLVPEQTALEIANYWRTHKRNPGPYFSNDNNTQNNTQLKYLAYTSADTVVYKNTTDGADDYLEIFKYADDQVYAALLPIL